MHKAREHQQPPYVCFVDFNKAFDSIFQGKFRVTIMDMGYPLHLIDLLDKLYTKSATYIIALFNKIFNWHGAPRLLNLLFCCSAAICNGRRADVMHR